MSSKEGDARAILAHEKRDLAPPPGGAQKVRSTNTKYNQQAIQQTGANKPNTENQTKFSQNEAQGRIHKFTLSFCILHHCFCAKVKLLYP